MKRPTRKQISDAMRVLVGDAQDAQGRHGGAAAPRAREKREGATENATVVSALLSDLIERGLDFSTPRIYILDGGKALHAAVRRHAGEAAFIQRCQVHIAGRDPRLPEGWKVPSRASPCEPGSLGSVMAG